MTLRPNGPFTPSLLPVFPYSRPGRCLTRKTKPIIRAVNHPAVDTPKTWRLVCLTKFLSWSASSVDSWLPMDATSLHKVPFKRSTQTKSTSKCHLLVCIGKPHGIYLLVICLPSRSYVFLNQELMNPSTFAGCRGGSNALDDGWVHKLISWHVVERNLKRRLNTYVYAVRTVLLCPPVYIP